MIERIFKSPKTTIIGLIILALCFVFVYLEKATLTEVSGFILGGFSMLFFKDGNDGSKTKGSDS
jgi:hypothetical protein